MSILRERCDKEERSSLEGVSCSSGIGGDLGGSVESGIEVGLGCFMGGQGGNMRGASERLMVSGDNLLGGAVVFEGIGAVGGRWVVVGGELGQVGSMEGES